MELNELHVLDPPFGSIDHGDAIALYATVLCKAEAKGTWSLSALDPHGVDLVNGDLVERVEFDTLVTDRATMRAELVRLAKVAREGLGPR